MSTKRKEENDKKHLAAIVPDRLSQKALQTSVYKYFTGQIGSNFVMKKNFEAQI